MIDVLVPVLGRPANAQPLADSARNTHNPYRLTFICSPGDIDQIEACVRTGADTYVADWPPGKADYAKKINWAYTLTHNPWVFLGADDITFHPEWDTHAFHVGERYAVVGTNDLHNPMVRRGQLSTHTLIRRSYIDTHGGTYDSSGLVLSEVYDHQYVDNEFVLTARRRGQFGHARRAIVEHHHPTWSNALMDATYEKALRNTRRDSQLFNQRRRDLTKTTRR